MAKPKQPGIPTTLTFEKFWTWLQAHANCIVRAGTPDAILFDDEDLHWHFSAEEDAYLVQVLRGKRVVGELVVVPAEVTFVQVEAGEVDDEHVFDLISENETQRVSAYHFVLSHGYDAAEEISPGRWTH
jgi:hypothetical protein